MSCFGFHFISISDAFWNTCPQKKIPKKNFYFTKRDYFFSLNMEMHNYHWHCNGVLFLASTHWRLLQFFLWSAFAGSARQQTVSVCPVSAGRVGVNEPHQGQQKTVCRKLKGKMVKTKSTQPTCRSQGRCGERASSSRFSSSPAVIHLQCWRVIY